MRYPNVDRPGSCGVSRPGNDCLCLSIQLVADGDGFSGVLWFSSHHPHCIRLGFISDVSLSKHRYKHVLKWTKIYSNDTQIIYGTSKRWTNWPPVNWKFFWKVHTLFLWKMTSLHWNAMGIQKWVKCCEGRVLESWSPCQTVHCGKSGGLFHFDRTSI